MKQENAIQLFEEKKVRTLWDAGQEKWYFSIVAVISILTNSPNPQVYWRVMKKRLKDEGNETVTNCNGLKMQANDGKMRVTDVADTEQLFRLLQSIPSPKAEPFKLWLAKIASERLDEAISLRKTLTNIDFNSCLKLVVEQGIPIVICDYKILKMVG